MSSRWTALVVEEFFRQGELERAKGMPISPMFDREDQNVPKSQRGFLQYVVRPFFEEYLTAVGDQAGLDEIRSCLDHNLTYWESISEDEAHKWKLPESSVIESMI